MLTNFLFVTEALLPVFLIIFTGWVLYNRSLINDNFVDVASKLVMNITFPLLLILKISALNLRQDFNLTEVIVIYLSFFIFFAISWLIARLMQLTTRDQGSFIQGAFRGNFGILGLAICANLYGEAGIAIAAVLLAFLIPIHNILSVTALASCDSQEQSFNIITFVKKVVLNPLFIAIIIGVLLSLTNTQIPTLLYQPMDYIGGISLPLALICIGATLKFKNRDYSLRNTLVSSCLKLILLPTIGVLTALLFDINGMSLGVLYILFAVPTAVVTFPLAQAMNANGRLASAIVVISTILSSLTLTIGLTLLRTINLI